MKQYRTPSKFNTKHIVFSFGVLSDWHIKDEVGQQNQEKLVSALTQLQETAENDDPHGLALLVAAGDLTHDGQESEIIALRRTLERAFDLRTIPFIYVTGNHDRHNPDCNAVYRRIFGDIDSLYDTQENAPDGILSGNRYFVVGGRHFITMDPGKYHKREPNTFSDSSKIWLDQTLQRITAEEPGAYVFVVTHLLMQDTCYGSSRGFFYATSDLLPVLTKYPQVITFGGHLHYPLNDERAIMQTSITSIETAALSDMLIDGFDCDNVYKFTKTERNQDFAQGLLVQIDNKNNIRVKRLDFYHSAEIGNAWLLDAPSEDMTHLLRYTTDRQRDVNPASIVLDGKIEFTQCKSSDNASFNITIHFDSAKYESWVRLYEIKIIDTASSICIKNLKHLTDFYRHPNPVTMPSKMHITLPSLPSGTYTIFITAQDCWGNQSKSYLSSSITIGEYNCIDSLLH